jgi:ribokinase
MIEALATPEEEFPIPDDIYIHSHRESRTVCSCHRNSVARQAAWYTHLHMKYDFVAFGDIVIDAFIKLKDAEVHCSVDHSDCELCVKFGQKIPYESVTEVFAVGNGPNAAVSAQRIGLASALVAHVGHDRNGDDCLATLKKEGVALEYVGVHDNIPTNYHYVLQYGPERTILVLHHDYPLSVPAFAEPPAWFYLTSLPHGTTQYQLDIARYAREHGVKLAFQPGTFQIQAGREELAEIYAASNVFFCNKEEAQQILGTTEHDMKQLLIQMQQLGPTTVIITDGPNGASLIDDTGAWSIPMYPDPAPPVSRTGAGDATASTTIAYLQKGMPTTEALMRGMINAAYVVQKVGAQAGLLNDADITAWYEKRPIDFVPKAL